MRTPRFIRVWFRTRPYQKLWWSVPALLGVVVWIVFGYILVDWRPVQARARYGESVKRALATKDYQTARVACQRLLVSGSESRQEQLFNLAQVMAGLGRNADATALLNMAAPLEKPGYAPAHLFLAKSLLVSTNPTPQTVKAAETHLKNVLTLDPVSIEANELLGWVYFQRRDWELAKKYLLAVVSARPETALSLAAISKQMGDEHGMQGWADRAVKYHRDKLRTAKLDSPSDRLAWAQALALQEEYLEAINVLEVGRRYSGNVSYETAMGDLCASWSEMVARKKPEDLVTRIKLLQLGLEYAPRNDNLLRQLVDLSRLEGSEAKAAHDAVLKMLGEGGAAPVLHFILGSDAWQQGETEQARKHFSLAFDLAPNMPYVANNMAMFLALGKPPDLPRALAIIQPLVEKFPNEPNFRDTRGQILVKMERWDEGVKDLEQALPLVRTKSNTHAALAKAYRGLGMNELAAEHEKLVREPATEKVATTDSGKPK